MKRRSLNLSSITSITIFVVLFDQFSKHWAQNNLEFGNTKVLIPEIIQFQLVKNTGAAFSLFRESTEFLGIVSFIVAITLIIWIFKTSPLNILKGSGFSFLLGGTIGNGIDRWFQGSVTDFLEFMHISFPIFNIADIAINIAVICLFIESFRKNNDQGHS